MTKKRVRMSNKDEIKLFKSLLRNKDTEKIANKFGYCRDNIDRIIRRKSRTYYSKYLNFPKNKERINEIARLKMVIDDYNNGILNDEEVLNLMKLIDYEEHYYNWDYECLDDVFAVMDWLRGGDFVLVR